MRMVPVKNRGIYYRGFSLMGMVPLNNRDNNYRGYSSENAPKVIILSKIHIHI